MKCMKKPVVIEEPQFGEERPPDLFDKTYESGVARVYTNEEDDASLTFLRWFMKGWKIKHEYYRKIVCR